jgi:hypothetical protein
MYHPLNYEIPHAGFVNIRDAWDPVKRARKLDRKQADEFVNKWNTIGEDHADTSDYRI